MSNAKRALVVTAVAVLAASTHAVTTTAASQAATCVVAAAGDVAGQDDYRTGAARSGALITEANPERVIALGDLAYDSGTVGEFSTYYRPTWGAFKAKTLAVAGNHEARTTNFAGLTTELGSDADDNRATTVCGWRVVLVNPYKGASASASYITAQRKAYPALPMLVAWHSPRFSSGSHGNDTASQPMWAAATAAGARIVLNGHDHNYERFAPMSATGAATATGTRQFVSGLGGHHPRSTGTVAANSEKRFTGQAAVLFLSLSVDGAYSWSLKAADGSVRDAGVAAAPATTPVVSPSPTAPGTPVIQEDFTSSAANFTKVAGGTWAAASGRYVLTAPASTTAPNSNLSVHNTSMTGDFTLTASGAAAATSGAWDDFSIVFDYRDTSNYSFASFNESNDPVTNGIFKVSAGVRTQLVDFATTTTAGSAHPVRIERQGTAIRVYRSGALVGSTTDSAVASGKVGFGSRNDAAAFDDLVVTGTGTP